ncbi:hypothetical protein T07_5854 [Trichinella nelsoni]|uniref:Uncharacterized protein n=1 Tax=Trichinella nelsoni TaxID=6336 RepID=A0A0V0RN03_9BILA|nr:hypothetical protein T07_5854 [Trichinella nelsoni]
MALEAQHVWSRAISESSEYKGHRDTDCYRYGTPAKSTRAKRDEKNASWLSRRNTVAGSGKA